jgi:hypothetical protein
VIQGAKLGQKKRWDERLLKNLIFSFFILDLLRRASLAVKKPFFRLASLNFSPNMPDFDCKICLANQKNGILPAQSPSSQQVY